MLGYFQSLEEKIIELQNIEISMKEDKNKSNSLYEESNDKIIID